MKRYHFLLVLLTSTVFCTFNLDAFSFSSSNNNDTEKDEAIASLKKSSRAFNAVAKESLPAVVFIETEVETKNSFKENPLEMEGPFRFFDDDLFYRFFGVPPKRYERRKQKRDPILGQGSGFIVSSDGLIITNNHVIQGADKIKVKLNGGKEFNATVVGTDSHSDIAIIKVDGKNLPFLELANSDESEVGDWVVAVGNPFGLQATLTVGVISAKGRNNLRITDYDDFIQTDAAINRGNSGGPLLNLDGQVIGINTAIATGGYGGGSAGIGFAIPSNIGKYVMDQITENGSVTRGFLGVSLQPMDNDLANQFGLDKIQGTIVTKVFEDTPAAKAGLQQGDIILKYNNMPVESLQSFRLDISMMEPGSEVSLLVDRNGNQMELSVSIGSAPENGFISSSSSPQAKKLGLEVDNIEKEDLKKFGYKTTEGVIVTKIEPDSSSDLAGIQVGDLILSINRKTVNNVATFNQEMEKAENHGSTLFLIQQGQAIRYILLRLK